MDNSQFISNFGAEKVKANIMKLIHTSDWHIGQQLYGYDRTEDHLYFFRQLKDICREEKPDALVVSGDIFDVSSPSAASMRMFTDFILELHEEDPGMKIVITSGNHDSASRIDVNRNLWRAAGIYVIGTVKRENGEYDFSDNVVKVDGMGIILAVPYINPAFMGNATEEESAESGFFAKGLECVAKDNSEDLPVVVLSHLTVTGCDRRGHRDTQIGKIDSISAEVFPKDIDYVALGHIHKPQDITEDGRIRYSGSPVAVGFDEDYPHSVSIVEIERGAPVKIREAEIFPKRELLTYPAEPTDFKNAIRKLKKFPANDEAFIRLNVRQDTSLPSDCEELATAATEGKKCKYCTIKYEYTGNVGKEAMEALSMTEFSELTMQDLARRYFGSSGVSETESADFLRLLSEIEEEIHNESTF